MKSTKETKAGYRVRFVTMLAEGRTSHLCEKIKSFGFKKTRSPQAVVQEKVAEMPILRGVRFVSSEESKITL